MTADLPKLLMPAQAGLYRRLDYWTVDPVPDWVGESAARHPDRPAVIDRLGTLDYAGFGRQVRRAACGLLAMGLHPGDAAALQLPNWRDFAIPAHTQAAFEPDGCIRSGDLVTVGPDGFLRVVGRRKEIIIRGGENISPAEIEYALYSHPKIADVAVVGVADARFGQRACAVVVAREGAVVTLADLTSYMADRAIAKFRWPEFVVATDQLPRTPTGKVHRDALRQVVQAGWPASSP